MDLPRLQGIENNKLRVIPGNCNLHQIINKPIYNVTHNHHKNISLNNDRTMANLNQTNRTNNENTDRIHELQNKLICLRGGGYY